MWLLEEGDDREVVNMCCMVWLVWVSVVECVYWKKLVRMVIGRVKGSCECVVLW